jgi:hypothetical protein
VLHAGLVNERAFERWLIAAGQDPWRLKVALIMAHSIWFTLQLVCRGMIEVESYLLWQQAARALLAAEQPEAALDAVLALAVQQAREVEAEAGCVGASRRCCSGRALLLRHALRLLCEPSARRWRASAAACLWTAGQPASAG